MTVRERILETFRTWQGIDRHHDDLNILARLLEAEFAQVPAPGTIGAVLSEIRRQGWQKVSPEQRREHMRWVARHPRPLRRKRKEGVTGQQG